MARREDRARRVGDLGPACYRSQVDVTRSQTPTRPPILTLNRPGSRDSAPRSTYLPALDGLRGLAVLSVLLYHGGVSAAGGGFLGVDAFFVLSGFLITGLLLGEADRSGRIRLIAFWGRRARRLLPALLVVVFAVICWAHVWASGEARGSLRGDVLATLGYVANWHFVAAGGDYFARTGPPSPLQHTWSLAIEEQFYLLWPLAVMLAVRARRPLVRLRLVALGGVVISTVLMALLAPHNMNRAYYGTDTRAQALLVGAALATVLPLSGSTRPLARGVAARLTSVGAIGALGWLLLIHTASGASPGFYRGGFLLAAVCVGALLTAAVRYPAGPLARALSWEPLRLLGVISYGLYLVHWPLFLALSSSSTGTTGATLLAIRLAATGVVALMSYRLIELPFRAGTVLPRWRAPVALATGLAVLAGFAIVAVRPLPTRGPVLVSGPLPSVAPPPALRAAAATRPGHTAVPARPAHAGPTQVLVLGDSVAKVLFDGMPRYPQVAVTNEAVLGCGLLHESPYRYFGAVQPVPSVCAGWPGTWQHAVQRNNPDVVALLIGRWEVMDRVIAGQWRAVGDPVFDADFEAQLTRVLPLLTANGAKVALLTPPYYHRGERPDGGLWPEDQTSRVDRITALLRTSAAEHQDQVTIVDLGHRMGPDGHYSAYLDGTFARYDGVHVTTAAATILAPWVLPRLRALDPRGPAASSSH